MGSYIPGILVPQIEEPRQTELFRHKRANPRRTTRTDDRPSDEWSGRTERALNPPDAGMRTAVDRQPF